MAKADPKPRYVALRLGLSGANKAYASVVMSVSINGSQIHDGTTTKYLVVTTGTRNGNGAHPPPTEAYLQWPITDHSLLKLGWNDLRITLEAPTSPPLQLVEAEVGVIAR